MTTPGPEPHGGADQKPTNRGLPLALKALAWAGGLILALLVLEVVRQARAPAVTPPTRIPAERAAHRHLDRLMSIPSLRERLARVTDREALAAALQLGGDALIYLDDSLLLERTRLLNNMFQSTPEDVCGAIAQARPSRQQLITAVATLDSVSQERWVEIAVKAIESQYRGMVPVVVTLDQLDGPLVQLLDGLDPDAAVSMNTVLSDPSTVTPAHACWAARLLYSRVLTMSEPERQILIRGLVQR